MALTSEPQGQNLVYWQPSLDAGHDTTEQTATLNMDGDSSTSADRNTGKRQSMYVELFEEMVRTVIEHETNLILPHEVVCLEAYAKMNYGAQFLFIRLCLRKTNKWHRLSALKYESELGDRISEAIQELCQSSNAKNRLNGDFEGNMTTHGGSSEGDGDYSFLAEDESHAALPDLLDCLSVEELKQITKQMKLKLGKNRDELIKTLISQSTTQRALNFTVAHSVKGKERAGSGSWVQSKLPFASFKSQSTRLREMVLKRLEKCIRISEDVLRIFQRINLIYFRNTEYSSKILTQAILSCSRKRNHEKYQYQRTRGIWPSRDALLAYEEALEIEMQVDSFLEGSGSSTLNPSFVKRQEDAHSINGDLSNAITRESMSICVEEAKPAFGSPRVQNARAVKTILDTVYPRWRALVEEQGEESARTRGLERFDCGHILTRIICKGSSALGILHEYERELEVLEALLAQRRWRRGRRGKWYERRALILMTHFPQNEETRARAYAAVVESLEDEDTSVVYRPKLERRLTQLEKKLKVPEEERHTCEGKLEKPGRVFIEGVRIYDRTKSLKLDLSLRPLSGTSKDGPSMTQTLLSQWAKQPSAPTQLQEEVNSPRWVGKSVWRGRDSENINVETLALQHYETLGFKGFHCEGQIIRTLYGLLFWDVIFAPVSGAFETPFQSAPLDIGEDTFYFSRKDMADQQLESIRLGHAPEILQRILDEHSSKKTWCVGVRWDVFSSQDLIEIATCLGGPALSTICRMLCEDYAGRTGGVPDLIIWNAQEGVCKFVEVKGPGDTVQENQKMWHDVLLRAGVQVDLCHVAEASSGTGKSRQVKSGPAKNGKNKSTSKRKRAGSDTEDEPEMDFSQMDIAEEDKDTAPSPSARKKVKR